jgi:hypothetical protein
MVKDIICLTHHNIVFLHIKQEFLHLSVVDSGLTSQVRMCGNSVPPQFISALVKSNFIASTKVSVPEYPLLSWAG